MKGAQGAARLFVWIYRNLSVENQNFFVEYQFFIKLQVKLF